VARLIVDMAGVDYIASAGIRPLLAAYKRVLAEDRFVEIIRAQPGVAKVLTVVGLGDLLPLGSGTMQIIDLLKQHNPHNDQAMRSARQFVLDLLITLGIGTEQAAETTEDVFRVCRSMPTAVAVEEELKTVSISVIALQKASRTGLSFSSSRFHRTLARGASSISARAMDALGRHSVTVRVKYIWSMWSTITRPVSRSGCMTAPVSRSKTSRSTFPS
jgi:hypothetical protein